MDTVWTLVRLLIIVSDHLIATLWSWLISHSTYEQTRSQEKLFDKKTEMKNITVLSLQELTITKVNYLTQIVLATQDSLDHFDAMLLENVLQHL
jgi:hypothetical protein